MKQRTKKNCHLKHAICWLGLRNKGIIIAQAILFCVIYRRSVVVHDWLYADGVTMPDVPVTIPESYELVRTISTSDMVSEYIVRHRADDILIRLKIFSFTSASGATTRRHSREHLRSDITFMEELEQPGIVSIFDYSDTKNQFWIATQPA